MDQQVLRNDANPYTTLSLPDLRERRKRLSLELQDVQRIVDAIDDAIGQRVADEVATYRRYHKKPEGTVTVQIEGVAVKSTVPKRPKWDTAVLEEICGELELEGGNPLDWVDYKLTVSEKKYSKAPEAVRRRLDRARTVEHGKEKIELGDHE